MRLQIVEEVDCFAVHSKCVPPTFMERRVETSRDAGPLRLRHVPATPDHDLEMGVLSLIAVVT